MEQQAFCGDGQTQPIHLWFQNSDKDLIIVADLAMVGQLSCFLSGFTDPFV